MNTKEINFDGIVGPTHNYSGLAFGNMASMRHSNLTANPREAALQGLEKMNLLRSLGIPQAVLPPQERPAVWILRQLGFEGTDTAILSQASREAPQLLSACSSAASMWTANAATVSPSADSADGRVHFTPANLCSHFHRASEYPATARILQTIFSDQKYFVHHNALPSSSYFGDEGAANHTRLCAQYQSQGLQIFTYGRSLENPSVQPKKFPARHTLEASRALSRLHRLNPEWVVFAQQNPEAIDAGVFHNDVISVGNENFFFYHEKAFVNTRQVIEEMQRKANYLICYRVDESQISLEEAVRTYLFNSQIVTLANGEMVLIAPQEAESCHAVKCVIEGMLNITPIHQVHYVPLHQSMRNGGGPACLRLRVVLTSKELAAMHQGVILTNSLSESLRQWITKHYRDELSPNDLGDPALLNECRTALDELTQLLELGSIYPFQL